MTTHDREAGRARIRATRTRHRPIALAMLWLALLVIPTMAHAQSSGGAMGGGDWDSPSSSSSSSSSPSSSHSDYDYSSSSSSGGGGGGYRGGDSGPGCDDSSGTVWVFILAALAVVAIVRWAERHNSQLGSPISNAYVALDSEREFADVTMLRVVLDARVRASVQAALAQIAATSNTGDAEGRARMLGEVTLLLRRHRAMWIYGAANNHPMTTLDLARARFQRQASRFLDESGDRAR